jgi:putative oxidoreductase
MLKGSILTRWLGPCSDYAYAGIRIVFGLLFACHGAQKLFGVLDADSAELLSLRGAAGAIEFFGGTLIALGLFVPLVAFVCSGQMAFAYFLSHAPRGFWPIVNGGELAALYCFLFLYVATQPAGPFSLDRIRRGTGR